jgi:hypothetical protein
MSHRKTGNNQKYKQVALPGVLVSLRATHSEYNTTQNNTTKAKYLQIVHQNTPTNRETQELTTAALQEIFLAMHLPIYMTYNHTVVQSCILYNNTAENKTSVYTK